MSALDALRDRERDLEEIGQSDAPDAPLARVLLALIREEEIRREDVDALHPEGADD